MRPLLIIGIGAALAAACLPRARADGDRGGFIEGKVLPAGIKGKVVAEPAVVTRPSETTDLNADGTYRIEVAPGTYHLTISAPGFAYADEEPADVGSVAVGYGQTATRNFELVPAATLSGCVTHAGPSAVAVVVRRSSAARSQRFTVWAHVDNETGQYSIPDLRPGVYDLLVISPERGIVEGCGSMLSKPDALSAADRKALLDLNAQYAQSRQRRDYPKMLALFSREFSDGAGNTYDKMLSSAAEANTAKPGVVVLVRFTWQTLLLQGDAQSAMAVVTQVTQVRHRGVETTLTPERVDLIVQYRKEGGAWRFYHMETIRVYHELGARITRLTGALCVLPSDYVATYSDDLRLGSIKVASGETSTGHDYAFPARSDGVAANRRPITP
jgi:hypothetical protein